MDVAYLQQSKCISPPIPPSTHRPLSVLSRVSMSGRKNPGNRNSFRRRKLCSASSSDILVAGSRKDDGKSLEVVSKKEDEFGDLKSWMHKNGLPPVKVVIKERPSQDAKHRPIHYVAASEDLQAGDISFSVPNSLVVTLERVLGNETIAELLTTNKLSELACLALYLMYEKKQGKNSFWYPYIRELDRQRGRGQLAVESPLLWSEIELGYLTGSPTKVEVIERAEGIKREYNELDTVWFMAGSLFQQYPYDIPTEAFPFEIFKQAFVAVQSCVVHLQKVSLARRFALVPLGPPLLAYRSNCKAMLTAVDGAVQLVVDRPYKAGESIVVWCGPQPNSKLLLNYGFVDEDNAYDRIVVEAALNTEDPQYQDKRMVAQRNGKLSVQVFHVYVGKEREAVSDMLPYLRLGYVSDPSEMQSVISSQGPICPVSPCMERAVLDQLADYFKTRLAGYPTTLSEDETLLADSNLDPKKRVATQLVRLEKKMLNACLEATVDLINQLPDHTMNFLAEITNLPLLSSKTLILLCSGWLFQFQWDIVKKVDLIRRDCLDNEIEFTSIVSTKEGGYACCSRLLSGSNGTSCDILIPQHNPSPSPILFSDFFFLSCFILHLYLAILWICACDSHFILTGKKIERKKEKKVFFSFTVWVFRQHWPFMYNWPFFVNADC